MSDPPAGPLAAFSAAMRARRPGHAATPELVALAKAVSAALAPYPKPIPAACAASTDAC